MPHRRPSFRVLFLLASLAPVLALPSLAEQPSDAVWGIDVSHHSGTIDWQQVAEHGVDFVFLKASEGIDDADPAFEDSWNALASHDIVRGAYHFYVTEDDPEEQARFFLSRVDWKPGDLAPVVDIELLGKGTHGDLPKLLRQFLDLVEEEVGVTPILYTSTSFWSARFDETFGRYPLWVAEYEVETPRIPEGWATWSLWQFQGDSKVPGIEKGADRSRLHPDLDLDALRIPVK